MAAGVTYEPLATTTLTSAASSITFSSISGSYTDLRLVVVLKAAGTGNAWLRFNSDTGTNYSRIGAYGDGTSAVGDLGSSDARLELDQLGWANTNITLYEIDIFSYAGSTNKTILCKWSGDTNGTGGVQTTAGMWRNTAAITTVIFLSSASNLLASGTSATLYGITKA